MKNRSPPSNLLLRIKRRIRMSYFIYVNGIRVPVSKEVYSEYWRLTNRENYLNRLEIQYRVRPFSDYADDQLTNFMADEKMNVEKITETKEILQLLALTFVRIGDVCSMKWKDIDFDNERWEFRPQKAGRRDDMTDLVTPLSKQAISILKQMKAITGDKEYVFYRIKEINFPVIVKDTLGAGSIGVEIMNSYEEVESFLNSDRNNSDIMVEELIQGEQFGTEIHGVEGRYSVLPPIAFSVTKEGITDPLSSVKFGPE